MTPEQILSQYFGYSKFRPPQREIIESVLAGRDTLAIMPTGGGKSLCYQVPALILGGQTLVISPLISLMTDQVAALTRKGISATYLSASLEKSELVARLEKLATFQLIYLTPERLNTSLWKKYTACLDIKLIAIDEAHCVSLWGHDFRPAYLEIGRYLASLKQRPPVLALTASATTQTVDDLCRHLTLQNPQKIILSPTRHNLYLSAQALSDSFTKELFLHLILQKHRGEAGIIYAQTRESCEYLARLVEHFSPGTAVGTYHAGLSSEQRSLIQTAFIKGELPLIVATNAFGMGIDKPNLRFIIHYGVPTSIENYYQEIGRAGRDGLPSACYLLHQPRDWEVALSIVNRGDPTSQPRRKIKLKQLFRLLHGARCLHPALTRYFGGATDKRSTAPCAGCHHCRPLEISLSTTQYERVEKLTAVRARLARQNHRPPLSIMTDQVLVWTAILDPKRKSDFLKIPGVGQGWAENWASAIITSI